MQERRILSLRVVMDEELESKFNTIKKELGLTSNAEVVRFLVNRFYKELVNRGGLIILAFVKALDAIDFYEFLNFEVIGAIDTLATLSF